jgi:hypothetical protein
MNLTLLKSRLNEALLALELMPQEVIDLVQNPTPGARYQWSYTAALHLLGYGYPVRLIEPLLANFRGRDDRWPGELRSQIQNARNTIAAGGNSKPAAPKVSFLSVDAERVWGWLQEGRTLDALVKMSPSDPHRPTEEILRLLFPDDPFICATLTSRDNQVKGRLSQYSVRYLRDSSFIVGSPFIGPGKRNDDNIASHRFFVVECDVSPDHLAWSPVLKEAIKAGFTARDLGAAALLYLHDQYAPLVMAVDSGPGGKSVHGWFFGPRIADHNHFCTSARKCGADPRITVPSQLWRCPWGTRRRKPQEAERLGKQPCLYLNDNYDS